MLAMAGALLSAVAMSGCESGRFFYDGPRSYMPAPTPASMTYAPSMQWNSQPRLAAGTTGVLNASAVKADGTPGPVEVTSSLQMVAGVNGVPSATPMLTITLPAVKFLVPINGTYSFTPPAGGSGTTMAAVDPASSHGATAMGPGPMDSPLLRAGTPGQPTTIQYTPPTIQYMVPTSPNGSPSIQYTVPSGQTAAPTIQYSAPQPTASAQPLTSTIMNQPTAGPKLEETVVTAKQPTLLTPPPPAWPKSAVEPADTASDLAVPPPPPPIHRAPAGGQAP
jgi:hypothetical protein